jgi:sugar lactone lactonase YvrE
MLTPAQREHTIAARTKINRKEAPMKRLIQLFGLTLATMSLRAQSSAPKIPADFDAGFLKLNYEMNLGEVLGVAVNSKGTVVVLNHPGSATMGPIYGNATTQLLEFDSTGKFTRELGKGVYGLGYAHSVRFDRYDNLWVVDKGANTVIKFNPAGMVVMNLGRRPEGPDEPEYFNPRKVAQNPPSQVDGYFNGSTDVTWDAQDNIYVSDGYSNSRIAKFDRHGNWIKSWGSRGTATGQFNTPHNIVSDNRDGNIYVADRGNARIQVFDGDGDFRRLILLNIPYDKTRHPVLGNIPQKPPDVTAPWALCMTATAPQYLYVADQEPGRIYKVNPKDGKILGWFGESGHELGQFNWVHGIACPSENTLFVADMNNWRLQKVTLHPSELTSATTRR